MIKTAAKALCGLWFAAVACLGVLVVLSRIDDWFENRQRRLRDRDTLNNLRAPLQSRFDTEPKLLESSMN